MLTKYIKSKLMWCAENTRSTMHATYHGRYGIYSWSYVSNEVYFRNYNINYHGSLGEFVGKM